MNYLTCKLEDLKNIYISELKNKNYEPHLAFLLRVCRDLVNKNKNVFNHSCHIPYPVIIKTLKNYIKNEVENAEVCLLQCIKECILAKITLIDLSAYDSKLSKLYLKTCKSMIKKNNYLGYSYLGEYYQEIFLSGKKYNLNKSMKYHQTAVENNINRSIGLLAVAKFYSPSKKGKYEFVKNFLENGLAKKDPISMYYYLIFSYVDNVGLKKLSEKEEVEVSKEVLNAGFIPILFMPKFAANIIEFEDFANVISSQYVLKYFLISHDSLIFIDEEVAYLIAMYFCENYSSDKQKYIGTTILSKLNFPEARQAFINYSRK